jgi:hypothetical protein
VLGKDFPCHALQRVYHVCTIHLLSCLPQSVLMPGGVWLLLACCKFSIYSLYDKGKCRFFLIVCQKHVIIRVFPSCRSGGFVIRRERR